MTPNEARGRKPMAEVPAIWKEQRTIESFEVDMFGRLRAQTLFGLLLNGAWNCAKGTVYGYQELTSRNLMWALLKLQLHIKRIPKWRDEVILETWGKRVQRLYALRDYAMSNTEGERVVSATTAWTILDRATGRPQRFDQENDEFPWVPEREALGTNLEKVPQLSSPKEIARYRVQFSDIDVNRHVNATKYLQWMIDSRPFDALEEMVPRLIEISFLMEALAKDEVAVETDDKDVNGELIGIRRVSDGKELCRGKIEWVKWQ